MTRKRSRRKGKPEGKPTTDKTVSSSAMMVSERIAAGGADYLWDNFIRIMQDCDILRREPEFADFYLDPKQTLEAAARHFPRFARRLGQVDLQEDEEEAAPIYDDYRIAVLDDLDSPQLRQQLQGRLKQCTDRLKRGHDAEKIELALFLSVLLSDEMGEILKGREALPLGLYGLVTTIYEDSFDRAMEETSGARDVVGDELYETWCARHREEDLAAIAAVTERISAFGELATHLETNPALARAWRRQEAYLLEEFQLRLVWGDISFGPGFFTAEEVALSMRKMEQRYWNRPWSLSRYVTIVALLNFRKCIGETLDEIVSPRRMAGMAEGFREMGQGFLEAGDERLRSLVPHVQAAIRHLQDEETPSQNRVVTAMYLLSFLAAVKDRDALGPHWRRLFERLERSFLPRERG
jgi:hypothetical protein